MRLLLDSSGPTLVCAVADEDTLLRDLRLPALSAEGRDIPAVVQRLLGQSGTSRLSSIAAGIGPGSFIGTRQAISLANGMAAVLDIPVLAFDSVAALVPRGAPPGSAALRDARRGQYYLHLQGSGGDSQLLDLEGCIEAIRAAAAPVIYLEAGSEASSAASSAQLNEFAGAQGGQLASVDGPDSVQMLLLSEQAMTDPRQYVEPVYLRSFL